MLTNEIARGISAVEAASSLANLNISGSINPSHIAKIPIQERGIIKFNKIIQIAEELVLELGIDNVSHYSIAKIAKIPPSTVYQYFPTIAALFAVMAEKHYMAAFQKTPELIGDKKVRSWKDLGSIIVESAYDFYTQDKISEILFLKIFLSAGVREYSDSRVTRLGLWYKEYFILLYKKSELEGLEERLTISLELTKCIFIRSINLYGEIKPDYKKDALLVVDRYLEDFFRNID
jgi:AcrR family transcriptional regulator